MNVVLNGSDGDELVLPLLWVEEGFDGPDSALVAEVAKEIGPLALAPAAWVCLYVSYTLDGVFIIVMCYLCWRRPGKPDERRPNSDSPSRQRLIV